MRTFRVVTSIIAVAALGVGCTGRAATSPTGPEPAGVQQTATPETASWKRFSSQKHGFEFLYPESCAITGSEESLSVGGRIELTILDSQGMGLSDYVAGFVENRARTGDWTIESIQNGSLSGQPATTVEYRFGGFKRYGTATFALNKSKVYVWGFTAGGFTCDEPEVYGPILASFRFTE